MQNVNSEIIFFDKSYANLFEMFLELKNSEYVYRLFRIFQIFL